MNTEHLCDRNLQLIAVNSVVTLQQSSGKAFFNLMMRVASYDLRRGVVEMSSKEEGESETLFFSRQSSQLAGRVSERSGAPK
jgi:hypothetical protein